MRKFWAVFLVIYVLAGTVLAAAELDLLTTGPGWTSESAKGATKIINTVPLGVTTKDYDLLSIRIRAAKPGQAELYWAPRRDQFSIYRNYPFYVTERDETKLINFAAYNRDGSAINHFLLVGEGTLEISELKLIKGGLWQKIVSGQQEFFGPLSRTQDGLEFLVIRSPRLLGTSFYYLLNLLLASLLLVVLLVRGKKDLSRTFLIALLVCWVLAELNCLRNNLSTVKRDSVYWGKSLEEKRALINGDDFYAFIKFADRELPPAASFDVLTSHPYYNFRAAYYLHPRDYQPASAYLLVYDGAIDRQALRKYKLWRTFRKGAYIFKS